MSQQNIKRREIRFCSIHADSNQAHSAVFIINDLKGIIISHALDNNCIQLAYDLGQTTLEEIEGILRNEGFHLDNSILSKIKRSIIHYCEETCQENSKDERLIKEVHDKHTGDIIYLRPKKKKLCDCKDQRSEHWRQYL